MSALWSDASCAALSSISDRCRSRSCSVPHAPRPSPEQASAPPTDSELLATPVRSEEEAVLVVTKASGTKLGDPPTSGKQAGPADSLKDSRVRDINKVNHVSRAASRAADTQRIEH